MNAEQLIAEIIAQRPVKSKPWKRRRRPCLVHARPLSVAEVCELKACVRRERMARCKPSNPCWEVGCVRCSPP